MQDTTSDVIEFKSRWRGQKKTSENGNNTMSRSFEESSTNTVIYEDSSCQTDKDSFISLDSNVFLLDGWNPNKEISSFILKTSSLIQSQLEKNFTSLAFQDYDNAITIEDADSDVSCKYHLSYEWNKGKIKPRSETKSDEGDEIMRPSESTSLSWNSTGSTIAISYGSTKHDGWCNHNAGACTWNIFKRDLSENVPEVVLESASCVMVVSYHPEQPALLAGGTFNGEILVWNTSHSEEPLVCSSQIGDYFHREPISQICWVYNAKKRNYDLVSISGDGKVLIWTLDNGLTNPVQGYLIKPSKRRSTSDSSLLGGTAMSFSNISQVSASFVIGTEGGAVMRCNVKQPDIDAVSSLRDRYSSEALDVISTIDSSNRIDIQSHVEKYARLNNIKMIDSKAIFESNPPIDKLYSSVSYFSFSPHVGPVHSLSCSPFHRNVFLSCGTDGTIKIYSMLQTKPLLTIELCDGNIYCVAWSKYRPLVFAAGTDEGKIYLFDLGQSTTSHILVLEESSEMSPVVNLAFNPKQRDFLSSCHANGVIRIWQSWLFSNIKAGEQSILDSFEKRV